MEWLNARPFGARLGWADWHQKFDVHPAVQIKQSTVYLSASASPPNFYNFPSRDASNQNPPSPPIFWGRQLFLDWTSRKTWRERERLLRELHAQSLPTKSERLLLQSINHKPKPRQHLPLQWLKSCQPELPQANRCPQLKILSLKTYHQTNFSPFQKGEWCWSCTLRHCPWNYTVANLFALTAAFWQNRCYDHDRNGSAKAYSKSTGPSRSRRKVVLQNLPTTPRKIPWRSWDHAP